MVEATDGREARAAVAKSRRRLEEAQAREPITKSLVARLRVHLEENHFADRLDEAFGREHGDR
jgi:hypothetical protein